MKKQSCIISICLYYACGRTYGCLCVNPLTIYTYRAIVIGALWNLLFLSNNFFVEKVTFLTDPIFKKMWPLTFEEFVMWWNPFEKLSFQTDASKVFFFFSLSRLKRHHDISERFSYILWNVQSFICCDENNVTYLPECILYA